ncbi:MAG: NAD(P)-dependent alcohol dehydrogenase [Chloroflexota bacterium]|jgi:NADPH:quinone reductase-like Zn-dependent oxidoreductase
MKAAVWTKYGPPEVLEVREVDKPAPKDNELLIKIYATTVTAGDCETRRMDFPFYLGLPMRAWTGFLKPKAGSILGTELAGEVEAVGKDVKRFKIGDQVFGTSGMTLRTNAQYICLPEEGGETGGGVALKPANMSYDEAATVPFGGRDALHFLRLGDLQSGQKILINGAGGSIGTFAIQLARHFGLEVTAVDSTAKLEMLRAVGADHVVDYTREDFCQNGRVYDVIFDVVGTLSFSRTRGSIKPKGVYLLANPIRGQLLPATWARLTGGPKIKMQTASGTVEDLHYLREMVEAGTLKTIIDRSYPLEEIVEAHRYVETGAKQGNVVITVSHDD